MPLSISCNAPECRLMRKYRINNWFLVLVMPGDHLRTKGVLGAVPKANNLGLAGMSE
jgi:hypothetical protein